MKPTHFSRIYSPKKINKQPKKEAILSKNILKRIISKQNKRNDNNKHIPTQYTHTLQ